MNSRKQPWATNDIFSLLCSSNQPIDTSLNNKETVKATN